MAIDTAIHRDPATGAVMLTVEQAAAVALWQCGRGPRPPVMDELATTALGPIDALCLWVLQRAPVVRAAEAQADAGEIGEDGEVESDAEWLERISDTEAAVRAARGEGEATS